MRANLVTEGGGWTLTEPKTQRSVRVVSLPPATMEALGTHQAQQEIEKIAAGNRYTDNGFVFAGQTGQPLDLRNVVARHFKPLLTAYYPLPNIRLYDLRHAFASNALAAGISVLVVSELLGHASAKMTLDVYGHVLPAEREGAAAKLAAYLAAGV